MLIGQWVQEAIAHAEISGAELARQLSDKLNRKIDRAAVQKMTITKSRGPKARGVGADEMLAISEITGYPLPNGGIATDGRIVLLIEPETRAGLGGGGFTIDRASAQNGVSISADAERDRWGIPTSFLRSQLRMGSNGAVVEVYGNSMHDPANPAAPGSLFAGDRVIVDVEDRNPSPPGHFLVWDGVGMVVKLVDVAHGARNPMKIGLVSINPAFEPYEATEDEVTIIGRVRGRISAM